jgi:hypothetical protein
MHPQLLAPWPWQRERILIHRRLRGFDFAPVEIPQWQRKGNADAHRVFRRPAAGRIVFDQK